MAIFCFDLYAMFSVKLPSMMQSFCYTAFSKVLKNVEWPEQFPLKDEDFQRFDE